jgi:hypothetical protein
MASCAHEIMLMQSHKYVYVYLYGCAVHFRVIN